MGGAPQSRDQGGRTSIFATWTPDQQRITPQERPAAQHPENAGAGGFYAEAAFLFWRLVTRSSTTAGSAKVEVSPRLDGSSSAILRRMRRRSLPERGLGRPGATLILWG